MTRKHDNRGRRPHGPPYVQLYNWIRLTEAWKSLAPFSRLLYIEIRGRFNGSNNGDISMSYREAADILCCSNRPINVAFKELEDRGFIRPVQKGSFGWKVRPGGKGRATTWRLTELPQDIPVYNAAPSYEFKVWTPPAAPKNKTRRANSIPVACEKHSIATDMACEKHPNKVRKAPQDPQLHPLDGVQNACTSKLPYAPGPIGPVSQALLNTRLVQRATAPQRGPATKASAGGRS